MPTVSAILVTKYLCSECGEVTISWWSHSLDEIDDTIARHLYDKHNGRKPLGYANER